MATHPCLATISGKGRLSRPQQSDRARNQCVRMLRALAISATVIRDDIAGDAGDRHLLRSAAAMVEEGDHIQSLIRPPSFRARVDRLSGL